MRQLQCMRSSSGDHHDVLRRDNLCPVATKKFSQQSFHPIPGDGIAEPPRDSNAQARRSLFGGKHNDNKMRAMTAFPAILEEEKLSTRKQASRFGE